MLVAVSLLAISLSVFIYHYPPSTWNTWPWVNPAAHAKSGEQEGSTDLQEAEPPTQPSLVATVLDEARSTSPSPQTTPKALPRSQDEDVTIPTFTLADHGSDEDEDDDDEDKMPPPSFPALNSSQRASAPPNPALMGPPPPRVPSLMPPPQIKPSNLRALPGRAPVQALRAPPTGPLPNRGPIPNRTAALSGGLGVPPSAASTLKTPNARNKVLLSPGHSPLDWANLQRSGENLSGVSSLLRVTPSMLKHHNGRKGKPAWSSYLGKVYNLTPYLAFHPGGEGELRRVAGKDGRKLFMEVHPWVNWENMLGDCIVGIVVSEEQEQAHAAQTAGGSLEDMD